MRLNHSVLSLTFVLLGFSANSAPKSEVKPATSAAEQTKQSLKPASPTTQAIDLDSLQVSPAPVSSPLPLVGSPQIWRRLSLSAGYVMGVLRTDEKTTSAATFGFTQTNYNRNETAQDYGLTYVHDGVMQAHWGYKFLTDWLNFVEPHYKVGFILNMEPSEGLGNFINYKRYALSGSVGIDNLFRKNRKFSAEANLAVSPLGLFTGFSFSFPVPEF
ncbi:MAG: hypothetical protein LW875_09540 [Proteobacteria bacterium]|jgi:hypothetical protein|nr:hypothetical protein [Pseudomonadota bacterium]